MHFANQVALVLFLVMLIAVAAGCSKPPQPKTEASAGASSSSSFQKETKNEETAGQKLDKAADDAKRAGGDATLTAKVKTAILGDSTLKSTEINVETFKGVVQLSGFVKSQADVNQAVVVAKNVHGVKSVKNDMLVK